MRLPGHSPSGRIGTPPRPYSFYVNTALFWKDADSDSDKPHVGATVVDSMEPGQTDVLRSEAAAAVGLLQQQVCRGDFRRHHTLPVGERRPERVVLVPASSLDVLTRPLCRR